MANLFLENLVASYDRTNWRENTEQLYKYLHRNMEDTTETLQELFPATWEQRLPILRPVPFVWRIARTLSTLYQKTPARRFVNLSPSVEEQVKKIYTRLDVDNQLLKLQEQLVALNNAVLWVMPDNRGGLRLVIVPPHWHDFDMEDPLSTDVEDVKSVRVKLPVGRDTSSGMILYGIAEITKTSARWAEAPGKLQGTGFFNEEGTNPLNRIPCAVVRGAVDPGRFFANENADLLQAQRALNLSLTDIGYTAGLQAAAIGVITGVSRQHAEEIQIGPETMIALPDVDQSLEFVSPKADLVGYNASVRSYLEYSLSHMGLNPDLFLQSGSGAISATAKAWDSIEREIEKTRHKNQFKRLENQLWQIIRLWVKQQNNGVDVYPDSEVEIEYYEPAQVIDPLHHAQALRMKIEDGQTSPVDALAKSEGISRNEALNRVRQNMQETRLMRESQPALDGANVQGRAAEITKPATLIK